MNVHTFGDLRPLALVVLGGGLFHRTFVLLVNGMVGSRGVGGLFGDFVKDVGGCIFFGGMVRHDDRLSMV